MDWIMIPLNCLIVFGTIYKVVELFVRKREWLMLISKLTEISNVDFKGINLYSSGNKFTALRIGWLMFGVGLGFPGRLPYQPDGHLWKICLRLRQCVALP